MNKNKEIQIVTHMIMLTRSSERISNRMRYTGTIISMANHSAMVVLRTRAMKSSFTLAPDWTTFHVPKNSFASIFKKACISAVRGTHFFSNRTKIARARQIYFWSVICDSYIYYREDTRKRHRLKAKVHIATCGIFP